MPRIRSLFLAVALVLPTGAAWWYFVRPTDALPLVYATAKILQAGLPLVGWWILGMGRRPAWRLDARVALHGLGAALLFSAPLLAAYALLFRGTPVVEAARPAIEARLEAFSATSLGGFLVVALGLSLAHSLFEEYYWRWFVFDALAERTSLPVALAVSGVAFASHHVIVIDRLLGGGRPFLVAVLTLGVAIAGAAWAWLRHRDRSLISPWIGHAAVDGTIFWIGWEILR